LFGSIDIFGAWANDGFFWPAVVGAFAPHATPPALGVAVGVVEAAFVGDVLRSATNPATPISATATTAAVIRSRRWRRTRRRSA
jgi:hypothetical protein